MIVSRVKAIRYFKGITQLQLSNMTGLCINTIRLVEDQKYVNEHIPKYTVISRIANALDVPKEKLIFKEDD
jgi:transcriptional regulator with XRE-family HTH domain